MNCASSGGAASRQSAAPGPAAPAVAAKPRQGSACGAAAALDRRWRRSPGFTSLRISSTVPIRSIGPSARARIVDHLLDLDAADRYLRFGYAATDRLIGRYVEQIDFERDRIFGIFNRRLEMVAMAHLAFAGCAGCDGCDGGEPCAEFGVSVAMHARGRGYGTRLFDRVLMHARNEGVKLLFGRALSENKPMLRLARRAGATVRGHGGESEAVLMLPGATLASRLIEMVCQRLAETDYRLKQRALRFS